MSDTFHQTVGVETMSAFSSNTVFCGGFDAIHTDRAVNWCWHFILITLFCKLDKWFKILFTINKKSISILFFSTFTKVEPKLFYFFLFHLYKGGAKIILFFSTFTKVEPKLFYFFLFLFHLSKGGAKIILFLFYSTFTKVEPKLFYFFLFLFHLYKGGAKNILFFLFLFHLYKGGAKIILFFFIFFYFFLFFYSTFTKVE